MTREDGQESPAAPLAPLEFRVGLAGAFIAPLVLGRMRYFLGSINSRMFANGSFSPERSTRRRATVTSSVPLAASASRIDSGEENFPVPTRRRL